MLGGTEDGEDSRVGETEGKVGREKEEVGGQGGVVRWERGLPEGSAAGSVVK